VRFSSNRHVRVGHLIAIVSELAARRTAYRGWTEILYYRSVYGLLVVLTEPVPTSSTLLRVERQGGIRATDRDSEDLRSIGHKQPIGESGKTIH